jgi:predicted ester cyclase
MSAEENKAVIRRFIEQVFEKHELAAVDELVAADFVPHSWPGVSGVESFKQAIEKVSAGKSDTDIRIDDMLAEGDKVAVRLTLHVVHHNDFFGIPAAGKEHTISETHIFYVKHGKVTEHWRDADHLGMMKQLGAFPAKGH